MKTKKHEKWFTSRKYAKTKTLTTFVTNPNIAAQKQMMVKKAEIYISSFFATHNLAFKNMDHLESILKKAFPDSEVAQLTLKRTKCTAIITNVLGSFEKEQLVVVLQNTKFSLLVDESTDISTTKVACIVVRFFHPKDRKVISHFFNLIPIFDDESSLCTAEKLFLKIIECITSSNIPLENIIGFGADGCNTMMGEHNSVSSRLRELCPGIVISRCICHSLHLCTSQACKVLPRNCEDLARNVYTFFKTSSKRINELKQFQVFAETEIHRMLHPSQTRWLSLGCVVSRMLEQWPALVLYFNEKWLSDRLVVAEQIYNCLNDPFLKLYYYFLDWILPKFRKMNEFFQSEKVLIANLHNKMESQFKELLLCYMVNSYVMTRNAWDIDPSDDKYFLNKKSLYLGIQVMNNITSKEIICRQDLLDNFYSRCLDFLKTGCSEILKRYDFKNSIFGQIEFIEPRNARSLRFHEKVPTLLPALKTFSRFCSENDWQSIDNEWRALLCYALPNLDVLDENEVDVFWIKLNEVDEFKTLTNFVLNILCIPHSNAQCERVFSKVNLIKTKSRNKLITETVNGNLLASQHVKNNGCCVKFEPHEDMLKKMNSNMYNFKSIVESSDEETE